MSWALISEAGNIHEPNISNHLGPNFLFLYIGIQRYMAVENSEFYFRSLYFGENSSCQGPLYGVYCCSTYRLSASGTRRRGKSRETLRSNSGFRLCPPSNVPSRTSQIACPRRPGAALSAGLDSDLSEKGASVKKTVRNTDRFPFNILTGTQHTQTCLN